MLGGPQHGIMVVVAIAGQGAAAGVAKELEFGGGVAADVTASRS